MSERSKQKRRQAKNLDRPRWSTIWLIYIREMRDQLRDRRTLFTIAILPILLYPLVGTLLLQVAQFTRQQPTSVCFVGTDHLHEAPALLRGESFADGLNTDQTDRLKIVQYNWDDLARDLDIPSQTSRWVREGTFDAVVVVPPAFADDSLKSETDDGSIQVLYNVASDQSLVARDRISRILNTWRGGWIRERLSESDVDLALLNPCVISDIDIAPESTREAAFWSKLLPFIMLVWALTGAFYPAIDLVAGEKERGTLETLLCSPALRSEIVWGKLGAVTTFSMLTAIMNAASMLVTSSFVFHQMGVGGGAIGAPPLIPMLWLLVALVPLSALFSALALAVAAMARSSKEGQYYLMPLMMVTLPLVMLPMLPGTTLSAGTSLIPVTGMFLMVRALVEGQFAFALWHLPLVAGVTAGCLWLAVNWARRQFDDESVLFGSAEQWELGKWVRHLWRDRQTAATPAQAFACGAIILVALFFGKLAVTEMPTTFAGIANLVLVPQIGLILAPALLMATMLTTSLRKSLRIRMPHWTTLPLAVLLGVTLHPMYVLLAETISYMYPISDQAIAAMKPFSDQISTAPWLSVIFLMAFVPAICEELAFRGFIFGGLVRQGGRLRAVLITALLFGISHGVLQQSIAATFMGLLLGWIALRTGSVLPGILIHLTNNTLSVSLERIANSSWQGAEWFLRISDGGPEYHPMWIATSLGLALTCLMYFATIENRHDESEADYIDIDHKLADPGTALAPA